MDICPSDVVSNCSTKFMLLNILCWLLLCIQQVNLMLNDALVLLMNDYVLFRFYVICSCEQEYICSGSPLLLHNLCMASVILLGQPLLLQGLVSSHAVFSAILFLLMLVFY